MIDSKTLDLIIRANVEKGGDLKKITQSISELGRTIEEQAEAAKRGEGSIETLRDAYSQLEQIADRLKSQADLVAQFQRTATAIEGTTKRVEAAQQRFDAFAATVTDVNARTAAQEDRLRRLAAAHERAQSVLQRHQATHAELGAQLRASGIDTNNLAVAEAELFARGTDLNQAFIRGQTVLKAFSVDMKAAAERARELAAAQKEAEKIAAINEAKRLAEAQEEAAGAAKRLAMEEAHLGEILAKNEARLRASAKETLDFERADYAAAEAARANMQARRKVADEAVSAAAAANTLARASDNLTPKFKSLRETIRGIVDPASAARSSLSDIEKEVKTLAGAIGAINGPVKDYQTKLAALAATQRALGQQADLVDTFRRQMVAVRQAREAFVQARNDVTRYAEAIRKGGADTDANSAALNRSKAAMTASANALAQSVTAARASREALSGAGIKTNELAAAQARMEVSARQATNSTGQLTAAVQKYGAAAQKAQSTGFLGGNKGGAGGFGVFNRIKQDIIGATASVVGLYGAFNLARESIEALSKAETIRNKIAVAVSSNDPEVIGKEYAYVRKQADYYGVSLNDLASSYGSFAIAGKAANYTTDQTRYTFEQLTAGMRVLGMNTEQSGRAFTQVQQILSKTKPELEDIKTIAESGFAGVQGLMAKGLLEIGVAGIRAGSEIQDMSVLMKKGMLDSQTAIYALAVAAEKELGSRVPEAIKSLRAEQGRFATAVMDFQTLIANSGFAEEYRKALEEIRNFFTSSAGADLARNFSTAFGLIAQSIVWVLKNLNGLTEAVLVFAAYMTTNFVGNQVDSLVKYGAQLQAVAKDADKTAKAIGALQKSFFLLQVFLVGWAIGAYLRKEFEIVQWAGIQMGAALQEVVIRVETAFKVFTADFPALFRVSFSKVADFASRYFGYVLSYLKYMALAAGNAKLYKDIEGFAEKLKGGVQTDPDKIPMNAEAKAAIEDMEKKLGIIRQLKDEAEQELMNSRLPPGPPPVVAGEGWGREARTTARPPRPNVPTPGSEDAAEKAAKKAQATIDQVTRALEALESKVDRSTTETLATQLGAIDSQYAALARKIGTIGGKAGKEFMDRLNESTAQLKIQLEGKFNKELTDSHQALQDKLGAMDAKAGRQEKDNLGLRIAAIHSTYQKLYDELDELRLRYSQNGRDTTEIDIIKQRMDSNIIELQDQERKKFAVEQLRKAEESVNDVLSERKARIEQVNQRVEAGLQSEAQARGEIDLIIADTQPKLDRMVSAARDIAAELFNEGTITPAAYDELVAKLDLAAASANKFQNQLTRSEEAMSGMIAGGAVSGIEEAVSALARAARGQMEWNDAIRASAVAFGQMTAQVLQDIARMILQEKILAAVRGYMVASNNAAIASQIFHSGGVVGEGSNRSRSVPAAWFANAPRYHAGGVAGLAADEVPTILQKNEEVLSKDSPRNIMNMKPGAGAAPTPTRFVLVDDRAKLPDVMASAEGERVIVEAVRRNIPTIKRYMKS